MKYLTLHNTEFLERLNSFNRRMIDQGRKKHNADSMTNLLREMFHYFENNDVREVKLIDQRKVDQYLGYLSTRKNLRRPGVLSENYINKHKEAIMRFIEFIEGVGIGQGSINLQMLKHNSPERTVLTEEEIARIYNAQDDTIFGIGNRAILAFLYGCGLRKGELHQLEVGDIDMNRGMIRLTHTKTNYHREVPMSSMVQKCVEEYLYNARDLVLPRGSTETHVMISERGQRMHKETITFRVLKMAREAGIDRRVGPHVLRHSIATHLLKELSLEEVADFLGHRALDSTQIYTHLKEKIK